MGILLVAGCSAPPRITAPSAASASSKLAITVKVASIDLFNLGRRIEKKDIERFAVALKREQIEVLAVQGISRYPNVKTRVDFVNELAGQADMRPVFSEAIDMGGRQQGNAVFSVYPIRSNQTKAYDVPSAFSESALRVAIDAGARDMVVVSTRLPVRASDDDLTTCVRMIGGLQTADMPFIVSGNLPSLKKVRDSEMFTDVQSSLPAEAAKELTTRVWYAQANLFKLLSARVVKTELGTMTVTEFGLYQPVLSQ
jgi:endonuclease/exonuclease/phosphatase family metal-dependent hydrolase